MLRQDRDFSTIDAEKRQFEERWRRGKIVIYMGLISGPNKADDTCGKTTGTMERSSTVFIEGYNLQYVQYTRKKLQNCSDHQFN